MVADHPVVHRRLVERREVLALEVLDDRDLERGVVVDLLDEGRDRLEAGGLRRAPAALAGDELELAVVERPDEDGLEDAVLADGRGKLVERRLRRTPGVAAPGSGSMRSTSMLRTPPRERPWRSFESRLTIAGESSRSSDRRRAAAARKSVLAKVDHLPGELAVGPSGLGVSRRRS